MSALLLTACLSPGQEAAPPPRPAEADTDSEMLVLSPFEVTAGETTGYLATTSLAGSRLNTSLQDVGSAISVVTAEFMRDTGAIDSKSLLQYTTNTEVGTISGNFIGARSGVQDEGGTFTSPNTNTRVRGLTYADNTRNFFLTDIPWEAYNMDRVDMQRGPNSILFGMGSPAGIINTSTKSAQFRNFGELESRVGSYGSHRTMLDYNRELIDGELAARVVLLNNDEQYRQKPTFSQDRRVFGTTRWEPGFLNRGGTKTILKANAEWGRVRSNNPRAVTPVDYITPWFTAMGKATYDPRTVQDNNPHYRYDVNGVESTYYPDNYGQAQANRAGTPGGPNPFYNAWIGNFAQSYGGLLANFSPGNTAPDLVQLGEFNNIRGISSTGAIDGSVAFPYSRRVAVDTFVQYALDAKLPYNSFGLYKNKTLTDPTIFDFYNNLLDGENKKEWQNFDNFNISLAQTFKDQRFGYEVAYDKQNYDSGQYQLMTDQKAGIYLDLNSHNLDGTPNANVGKPFISDSGIYGNNARDITRESSRITLFADHDFNRDGQGGWVRKLLGRHTLSGLYSTDSFRQDGRNFMRWGTDLAYAELVSKTPATQLITDNQRTVAPVIYLTQNSLSGLSSASGAYIPRAGAAIEYPAQVPMYYFDSTWKGGGVDPAAAWTNPFNGQLTTQSENPANYAGWVKVPVNVLSAENGAQDALTTSATLQKKTSESRALILQSHFWNDAIVTMYGIRQDRVKSWSKNATTTLGRVNFDTYELSGPPQQTYKENSPSWSVVAKLDKLIGGRLPYVDINLYYNRSQNFQVSGARYDVYGHALPLPSGRTTDKGILIATKDGRYSLKVNKYESTVQDASSSAGLNSWFLGGFMEWGSNYADVFANRLGYTGDMSSQDLASRNWHYTYTPINGQTQAEADALMNTHVAAWRALQAKIPADYYAAWSFTDINAVKPHTYQGPANLTLTEDQVSRGYEFEFTANPTPNWRITANASKVEAIRNNVGGAALIELVDIVNTAMTTTPAGDLRIWSGGTSNYMRQQWNQNFYSDYSRTRLSEGNSSPELREWRFNLVTSYDFRTGFLKGATAGIGYRWQDEIAIGYKPVDTDNPAIITFDLSNPYMGPTEDAVDFWIGYSRKVTEKIKWRIQLNVRDAFKGNHLIPLTTQPDGSVAAWRIGPSQTWTLTNSFTF